MQNGNANSRGYNESGQLGNNSYNNSSVPTAIRNLPGGVVTSVACGYSNGLALQNGAVYSWGSNDEGELGLGYISSSSTVMGVSGLSSEVTTIAAGYQFGLAIKNGSVYAWGENERGELGNGTTTYAELTPAVVNGLTSGATAIAGGNLHSLAVRNGAVYAWGWNAYGQLGNGTTTDSSVPVPVTGLTSGVNHHCLY